ncbi:MULTISPECIES: formylglycine-generating enzyme family protein [Idiomarina]|uniref:formylglycine-generating enzyme family protein n=1 Tax=Idiomarina TaxID=135575 RepID=UPI00129AE541|nr:MULTISPECIES: formylglycine-generating enzyme family protein [Idiomarina]MDX1526634.1 formylglycine-generating enzyme family protein [Pseudidiomarina maritima]
MKYLVGVLAIAVSAQVLAEPVLVEGGQYVPVVVLDKELEQLTMPNFMLDAAPVTHAEYQTFVLAHPKWRRDTIPAIFHDGHYLKSWQTADSHAVDDADKAVTQVSWFAARAYCKAQGGRLPSLEEWEYASAQYRQQQGLTDHEYARMLFSWHTNPTTYAQLPLDPVAGKLNHMHDRVNEWVEDFQLLLTNGDDNDVLSGSCGDSARFMADFGEASYATFFRYQSRSNYRAQSTTSTLGFRCAYDVE